MPRQEARIGFVIFFLFLLWLSVAEAQTNYQRIKSFGPFSDGVNPVSRLIEGSDGLLYGTTRSGGSTSGGAVFSIKKDGSGYTVLPGFTNGFFPVGGLIENTNGALYGTTENGGSDGYGLVFRLNKTGLSFTVLHEFKSNLTDGGLPFGDLAVGLDGKVFGTTIQGGSSNVGAVFRINPDGSGYTNLHFFTGATSSDGSSPYAGLMRGKDGAFYGTTQNGGTNDFGTVFKLKADGTGYAVLHHFHGSPSSDGRQPLGTLIQGTNGLLYGTTYYGGSNDVGTVFRLNTNGGNYSVLLNFNTGPGGYQPWGGLAGATNGTLYGTTRFGGLDDSGTAFKMNSDGSGYSRLHSFKNSGGDGYLPQSAPLLVASDGALYGVTPVGGDATYGVAYKLFDSPPKVSITNISKVATGVLLGFAGGAAGQTYNVQSTTDIRAVGGWQVVGSVAAGIDGRFQYFDPTATNQASLFYRTSTP